MPNFRNLIDADLERIRADAHTELNRRRAEREKIAKRLAAYAERAFSDARRSDEELKALLAAKKRQELMDRAERLAPEPRRVSLSHWGMH